MKVCNYQRGNQKPYIEGQNTMVKGKRQIIIENNTTLKTEDWATRIPLNNCICTAGVQCH
jgi:hypothetical protein